MSQYLTPEEVASQLKVDRRTVYSWLKTGELKGFKIGRIWRIPREVLKDLENDTPQDGE